MEIKETDLNGLVILWQASTGNKELRKLIEEELHIRIAENKNFSREYLFKVSIIQNHAIGISFVPTTDSFNEYGSDITIDLLLSEQEIEELTKNNSANPPINTTGQLRARALVKDGLIEGQIKKLEEVGFHTREILEIQYRCH